MIQTVGVWGNNLAVRLPKSVSFLKKGQAVEVLVQEDLIKIVPVKKKRSIEEILANEDISTHPGIFIDFGNVGREVDI